MQRNTCRMCLCIRQANPRHRLQRNQQILKRESFPSHPFLWWGGGEFWNAKNPIDFSLSYLLSKTGYSTRWNNSHQQNLGKSSPIRILRNRSLRYGRTVHHVCVCTTPTRYPESFLWMFEWAFRRHGGGVVCSFRVSWTTPPPTFWVVLRMCLRDHTPV